MTFVPEPTRHPVQALSLRECRMIVERILLTTALPHGLVPEVRDVVIYAQALGLGAFEQLIGTTETPGSCAFRPPAVTAPADGPLVVDFAGTHAWVAAPTLLDLLLEQAATGRAAAMLVEGVADIRQLAVLPAFARRCHATLMVAFGPEEIAWASASSPCRVGAADGERALVVLTGRQPHRPIEEADPVLRRILAAGLETSTELWWRIYHHSNRALATDSVVSRRHAGPVYVDETGRLVGRLDTDENFDFKLLTADDPVLRQREGAAQGTQR